MEQQGISYKHETYFIWYVGVLKRYTSNYSDENIIHLGATISHLQHILSNTRPTIRLDPSSTLGSANLSGWTSDSFIWYHLFKRIHLNLNKSR